MHTMLAAMASVAAAFAIVLGVAFTVHGKIPAVPDGLFGLAAALAIPAIAGLIFCVLAGISPWKYASRAIARIDAARIEWRSAAQIADDENRDTLAACVHLQPIERAMRMAGLDVRLLGISEWGPGVKAACRINQAELIRVFALPASIYYREGYQPERSQWDNPRADIFCAECLKTDRSRCDILVLHPDECGADTPWFSAPP